MRKVMALWMRLREAGSTGGSGAWHVLGCGASTAIVARASRPSNACLMLREA